MKYILKIKPDINLDFEAFKDLKELLSLHNITILEDNDFPRLILIESEQPIDIEFNEWDVFPERYYEVPKEKMGINMRRHQSRQLREQQLDRGTPQKKINKKRAHRDNNDITRNAEEIEIIGNPRRK